MWLDRDSQERANSFGVAAPQPSTVFAPIDTTARIICDRVDPTTSRPCRHPTKRPVGSSVTAVELAN
jgi:hypothetical protein